jgi:hypothetical protein
MSTQIFVLAKSDEKLDLVSGDFSKSKVGDLFARHPVYGTENWKIVKIFDHDEQENLKAMERLMGFERLSKLFSTLT